MQPMWKKERVILILAAFLSACATTGPTEIRQSPPMPPEPSPVQPSAGPSTTETLPPVIDQGYPRPAPIEPLPPAAQPSQPRLVEPQARALVTRLIPPNSKDRAGWAQDILTAFNTLRIAANPENFCAVIAVTEQESLFVADPPVPGLPKIVWKEIETRRTRYGIPKMLLDAALLKPSPDGRSYRDRINALRTESQMNTLYQDMISELPYGRTLLASHNPVHTGGPMQVSVAFAEAHARQRPYPYPVRDSIRSEVFSRRGGMYFGIAILLDYPAPYSEPVYRFADFNAGRYSSRNAAFQRAVSRLSGRSLDLDGDLLRYRDGRPSGERSETQRALSALTSALGMGSDEIDRDLRSEKETGFAQTRLYRRVFALADQRSGAPAPRAEIPRIDLKSPKISRKLTTEWFAKRVEWRYRNCLTRQ